MTPEREQHRTLILALLVLASIGQVSAAGAQTQCLCSSSVCPSDRAPFFAVNVAPGLAPNARIFARLSQYDPDSVTLATSAGDPVEFTLEPAGDSAGSAFWVVPSAPLPAGTYVLAAALRGSPSAITGQQFSVAAGDDTTAPEVSGLRTGVAAYDYCSELLGGWITWGSWGSTDVVRSVLTAEVELWRDGVMLARVFPAQPTNHGTVEFGTSPTPECFGAAHIDGLIDGEELTARVRVWDAAGNATAFESTTFTVGHAAARPSCARACSATPGRGAGGAVGICFALVAATMFRRRNRRA